MREPDEKGPSVSAWKLTWDRNHPKWRKDYEATLAMWLINARGYHPFWSWWTVSAVHLRPIEGVKLAHKQYPHAEYEIMIFAIDPRNGYVPDPDKALDGYPFLQPVDLVHQFHGISDSEVVNLVQRCIWAIRDGFMSPDQDFSHQWKILIDNTIEHKRFGGHYNFRKA
jgi:hypothetical protein